MTRDTGQKYIFMIIQSPENTTNHKRAMETVQLSVITELKHWLIGHRCDCTLRQSVRKLICT